jgi:hypothetical protein
VRKFPSLQAYPLSGGQGNQIRTTEGPTSDLRRVYEMGSNLDFWTGGNSQQLSNILRLTHSRSGKSSGGIKSGSNALPCGAGDQAADGTCASGMAS